MINLKNKLPNTGTLTSYRDSDSKKFKKKFLKTSPTTLNRKPDSKSLTKKFKNFGPPNLHEKSDSKSLKRKLSNASELLDLKISAPSDKFKSFKVGRQGYSVGHSKQYSIMKKNKSVKELPVDSEIVDYPINLTGKGNFQ